jgi:RNA polymerase sigma factor (sigma-70 family)
MKALVEKARNGDPDALEAIVRQIQDRIYGLAMRMLWHPQDAEDATQEILVKIVTHLGSFRNESAFATWCYRIAANHLLSLRKRRAELFEMTFDTFKDEIDRGMEYSTSHSTPEPEQELLATEVMVGCIQGTMLCLDRQHRLAYVLGEIYEVNSSEGAEILDISPEAFRKRLSRARTEVRKFLSESCGLVDSSNQCSCTAQIPYAIKTGLVNPKQLLFAQHPCRPTDKASSGESPEVQNQSGRLADLLSGPEYEAPNSFLARVRALIDSGSIDLVGQRH